MQATVATFSSQTRGGTVLLDDGTGLPFDADAFAGSGLRFLRLGQRVNIRIADGRIAAITLATLPLG
jgi:cold shock CspA family protein